MALETIKSVKNQEKAALLLLSMDDKMAGDLLHHLGDDEIKKIGNAARHEISTYLNKNIHLFLFVKVAENWANKPEAYRLMGLDFNS